MAYDRPSAHAILTPEQVAALVVQPTFDQSVAGQVLTVIPFTASTLRVPVVTADPNAAWTAESSEIPVSQGQVTEAVVDPRKLAGLSIVTRELALDSDPAANELVGAGLARDLARKLDAALFGPAAPAGSVQPDGLVKLGTSVTSVSAGTAWSNLDAFAEAAIAAEGQSAMLTAWVANPTDVLALAKLKAGTGSNMPLLAPGGDPTQPARRVIEGRPVFTSPSVAPGTVWGIPGDRVILGVREDATIEVDASVFFTSDRLAVRAILRCGFAFPHASAIVKVTKA